MFAASRNDNVIGRTKILVVSIMTKNGFNHSGAPSGRKWAVDFLGEYINVEISILSHIGRPISKVISRCLDVDIEYGTIPIILIVIIITNSLVTVDDIPFILIAVVRNIWVIMKFIIGMNMFLFRCEIFHILDWISTTSRIFMITVIVVVGVMNLNLIGSKIEKMSLIIKIWCEYHLRL